MSAFEDTVADRLAALPGVVAVALGGSRATGTARPDSDWDFGLYYRGGFDPAGLRAIGWPGEVTAVGGWGGGIMNGGGWLTVDGRRVDVIYRDLDEVAHHTAEAEAGRFRIEELLFYTAGVPTYLVVAELAINRVLRGALPRPSFPPALRAAAAGQWAGRARLTLDHARTAYAARGLVTETAGSVARAALQAAHGILAARGEWVLNEKRLLDRAGLRDLDAVFRGPPDLDIVAERLGLIQ